MTMFWNRQNQPIEDTIEWAKMFEDPEFRLVAVDQDGEGTPMVSTIWQGLDLDHSLYVTDDTAMIFETAYLDDGIVLECWHEHTEEQALHRHRIVCLTTLGREPAPDGGLKRAIVENEKRKKK
jgi:hypothetical protein